MKTDIIVNSYTIAEKEIVISEKLTKLKVLLNTLHGEITGEINYSVSEKNKQKDRSNYTLYCAHSKDDMLQELISKADTITWKKTAGKILLEEK